MWVIKIANRDTYRTRGDSRTQGHYWIWDIEKSNAQFNIIISIYLRFRKHQRRRDLKPLRSAEILILSELLLQFEELLGCKGGPGPSGFAQQCVLGRATYYKKYFV